MDIKNGRTVKGINFKGLRDAGDPIALAQKYEEEAQEQINEEGMFALFDEYEDEAHSLPDRDAFASFPEVEED